MSAKAGPDLSRGLILVGNRMCPFAQRAWFGLEESGLSYEHCECQLYPKPQWLLDINPRGKVPVLVDEGKAVVESEVIVDVIAEKARHIDPDAQRTAAWRGVVNDEVLPAGESGRRSALQAAFAKLDAMVAAGPYVHGTAFGVADISAAPMLQRLFEDGQVPKEFVNLHNWWEHVSQRPAFVKTKLAPGSYWWWW
mmetsp:Transcript_3262/g.8994  ORF Transcript_3262/g.8994 Transcript_3262/m.8994 type:complete len:195 (-) Transcript_3262:40-624(-)